MGFGVAVKGSGDVMCVPLGEETVVRVSSSWDTPQFVGAYLPSERTFSNEGFSAEWNISSFGRTYPQSWETKDAVSYGDIQQSMFGVALHEGVGLYAQVERSIKYAVLFILITFTTLFLFEMLASVRIHPVQYLFIGSALALFYLLLLSLTEHLGFLRAYVTATVMIVVLITGYSLSVLKQKLRAVLVSVLLVAMYSYMYFVLKLEDYALLFGSLLIFVLLGGVMYLTRKIDWFGGE